MKIFLYWENKNNSKKPEYLNLCLKTITKNCGVNNEVILLNENSVYEYLPNLRPEIKLLPCIAHKADYIRANLLYHHGGIWFDSDFIVIKNIDDIVNDLNTSSSDFIGCGRSGNRPSLGFMGAKKYCKLIEYWINDMDNLLSDSKDYKFKWTDLGYNILWKYSTKYNYHHYPFNVFIPYYSGWKDIFFCEDGEKKKVFKNKINNDTKGIALYNALFPTSFKKMTESQLLNSKYFICDLLKDNI